MTPCWQRTLNNLVEASECKGTVEHARCFRQLDKHQKNIQKYEIMNILTFGIVACTIVT